VTADLRVIIGTTEKEKPTGLIHVEVEETLGHYAKWLEVTTGQIRRMNKLRHGRGIILNQEIVIPLSKVSKEVFEGRRYEYQKEIIENFFTAYSVVETKDYSVRKGDNMWRLCEEIFDIPQWLFKKYNPGVNVNALQLSQVLRIPSVERN
jgi:membrane-bound lytic murein transglycosylase D